MENPAENLPQNQVGLGGGGGENRRRKRRRNRSRAESVAGVSGLLRGGLCTSAELQAHLRLGQTRVSALLRSTPNVVVTGAARHTQYGLLRGLRGSAPAAIPLYRVAADSNASLGFVGELLPVEPSPNGGVALRIAGGGVAGGGRVEFFEGFPWFLADMRPQGFLGRRFPRCFPELRLPDDIGRWNHDDVLVALSNGGWDATGGFVLGERSAEVWLRERNAPFTESVLGGALVPAASVPDAYPQLAARAEAEGEAGSSAGGEQPKFLCRIDGTTGAGGSVRHVLVKFARTDTAVGRRWAFLLRAEHLALETLRMRGVAAVASRIIESGQHVFLETERFDRIGRYGRRAVVTAGAVADFLGGRGSWCSMATLFEREGWLGAADVKRIRELAAFSAHIGNTDTHAGNLTFFLPDSPLAPVAAKPPMPPSAPLLTLAPAYDVLPMFLAPSAQGALPEIARPAAAVSTREFLAEWETTRPWAEAFWNELAMQFSP